MLARSGHKCLSNHIPFSLLHCSKGLSNFGDRVTPLPNQWAVVLSSSMMGRLMLPDGNIPNASLSLELSKLKTSHAENSIFQMKQNLISVKKKLKNWKLYFRLLNILNGDLKYS